MPSAASVPTCLLHPSSIFFSSSSISFLRRFLSSEKLTKLFSSFSDVTLAFPYIHREKDEEYFKAITEEKFLKNFDSLYIRCIDDLAMLLGRKLLKDKTVILASSLYAYNDKAADFFREKLIYDNAAVSTADTEAVSFRVRKTQRLFHVRKTQKLFQVRMIENLIRIRRAVWEFHPAEDCILNSRMSLQVLSLQEFLMAETQKSFYFAMGMRRL